ncbi:hypothetical protein GCM10027445_09870 [Amycolatopsis endophytica]|uniref:Nitrogen fixation-related uncharacterized protein n=1 Tax=Amycolatopsis endophytica TaxID=860233 RepID=A0A853AWV8_9PSEU|nr:hypothetical protein [Amycolatopsis endophytica]NYI87223.1 nitrogen fixation-related uncharacterized protein [Amycolatopsis endophytica]
MAALILVFLLIALVVWGLNRNHRRQAPPRLSGSFDIEDRDAARVLAETVRPAAEPEAPSRTIRHYALRVI